MAKQTKTARLAQEIRDQRRWIEEHGGSEAGYVKNYGSRDDAEHSGNGGEAIYAADVGHLRKLEDEYARLARRTGKPLAVVPAAPAAPAEPVERELVRPLVHLNGSGRARLVEEYQGMRNAMQTAIEALCRHRPHGRDYYPLGDDVWAKARDQHEDRIAKLRSVQDEIEDILTHLSKEG